MRIISLPGNAHRLDFCCWTLIFSLISCCQCHAAVRALQTVSCLCEVGHHVLADQFVIMPPLLLHFMLDIQLLFAAQMPLVPLD